MDQSRKHLPLYLRASTGLFVAFGFSLGGALHSLFIRSGNSALEFLGIGAAGAVGGAFLALRSKPRRSVFLAAIAYGLGFQLGGWISMMALWYQVGNPSLPFFDFYFIFILGFGSAGAISAALIRPRLMAVRNSAICFLVGSAVGGIIVAILSGSPVAKLKIAAIALTISYGVGGAVSGMILDSNEGEIDGDDHVAPGSSTLR
ncbi:MAG TPA: hypothetical protein VN743_00620 [Blastocatellia bacterium]|nr:hypothetical protein [Blastocatellia bacterium]